MASRPYDHPSEADRYQMIRTYFSMLIEEELPDAIGKMKMFVCYFTHAVRNGSALRSEVHSARTAAEVLKRVENFAARPEHLAAVRENRSASAIGAAEAMPAGGSL